MLSFLTSAIVALSFVGASPLLVERQASASSAPVGLSSVVSAASSALPSGPGAASTARSSLSSSLASVTASSVVPSATTNATANPAYPCPSGYSVTYAASNVTVPFNVSRVAAAFGNWSSSPFFPNATNTTGGSTVNASHTIRLSGLTVNERLVDRVYNATTGYRIYIWNSTNGPYTAGGTTIDRYQSVLEWNDVGLSAQGRRSNTTLIQTFTNFCALSQTAGIQVVKALQELELGILVAAINGTRRSNSTVA